jgi:hypothetical protein
MKKTFKLHPVPEAGRAPFVSCFERINWLSAPQRANPKTHGLQQSFRRLADLLPGFGTFLSVILLSAGMVLWAEAAGKSPVKPEIPDLAGSGSGAANPFQTKFQAMSLNSPDGLHHVETTADGRLKYQHRSDGSHTRTLNPCEPTALAFSNDSSMLAVADLGKHFGWNGKFKIRIWYLHREEWPIQFNVSGEQPLAIAISNERVVLAGELEVRCFSISNGELIWSVPIQKGNSRIIFFEGESHLVVAHEDGNQRVYDARTGGEVGIAMTCRQKSTSTLIEQFQ